MKKKVCNVCHGMGHDKNSRPVVKFVPKEQEDGTMKRVHTTIKQGSGCLNCGGMGVKS